MTLIFVDCEAYGGSPSTGELLEFGAVEFKTGRRFHGVVCERRQKKRADDPQPTDGSMREMGGLSQVLASFDVWLALFPNPLVFVSDNPAYDWQWINDGFHVHLGRNPFGHSARRIGDFYAGTVKNWRKASDWKRWRKTQHDHHPVHDAQGNVEAFRSVLKRAGIGDPELKI
jgi:hypothetical protein